MIKRIFLTLPPLLAWASLVLAGNVTLSWDPVVHPDLSGYRIYWSDTSGQYADQQRSPDIPAGTETYTWTGDTTSKVYFVATAFSVYGEESDYSNEVHTLVEPGKTKNLRFSIPPP